MLWQLLLEASAFDFLSLDSLKGLSGFLTPSTGKLHKWGKPAGLRTLASSPIYGLPMQDFFENQEEWCCAVSVCFLAAYFTKSLEVVTQVNCLDTMCEGLGSTFVQWALFQDEDSLTDKVPTVSSTSEKISERWKINPSFNKKQQVKSKWKKPLLCSLRANSRLYVLRCCHFWCVETLWSVVFAHT